MSTIETKKKLFDIQIRPVEFYDIPSIVKIHQEALNYSLNSMLGLEHLQHIYRITYKDPNSIIMIAHRKNTPVGVAVATIDVEQSRKILTSSLSISQKFRLLRRLFSSLDLILKFFETKRILTPIFLRGERVTSRLSVIAVDKYLRKAGIGRALINSIEGFFKDNKCYVYYTDTMTDNIISRSFYKSMGFIELEQRGRSIILVKEIL